ncbi:type II secretory pathway, component ExeA (putative ATPase) [Thiovulum sp. ES]|nr:type II secretory pathway, component ExeA (putative ATPase) [Thiovulum sp. ES]
MSLKDDLANQKMDFEKRIFPEKISETEQEELVKVFKEIEEIEEPEISLTKDYVLNIFSNNLDLRKFIRLDSNSIAIEELYKYLNSGSRITLLLGENGTGKSLLLKKMHHILKEEDRKVVFFEKKVYNDEVLFEQIVLQLFSTEFFERDLNPNFENLLKFVKGSVAPNNRPIILMDNAESYSNTTLNKLRVLSDTGRMAICFVAKNFTDSSPFSNERFMIGGMVRLDNLTLKELEIYIKNKLMRVGRVSLFDKFTQKFIKIIHTLSDGNFKKVNKLIYNIFLNYPELSKENSSFILSKKHIEVTAIQLGFIKLKEAFATDLRHLPTAELVWNTWNFRKSLKLGSFIVVPSVIALTYILTTSSNKDFGINKTELKEQDFEIAKPIKIDNNFSAVQDLIAKKEIESQNREEKSEFVKPIKKEKILNQKLSEINFNRSIFKNPLKLSPKTAYFNNEKLNLILDETPKAENKYIVKLENDLYKNETIDTLLKIIDFYRVERNYEMLLKYSLLLNNKDSSLQIPYNIIYEILQNENQFKDAEKVLSACKNCKKEKKK